MTLKPLTSPVMLFAAFYLGSKAQAIRHQSILEVWDTLKNTGWPSHRYKPEDVANTVSLWSAIVRRFGLDGGCIPRSLVAGRLLLGHEHLSLKIGIYVDKENDRSAPMGHAWLELNGRNLSDPPAAPHADNALKVTRTIPLLADRK